MKRNLLKGIILFSAVALSSCSTIADISKSKALGDDVYYTKAKAGILNDYVPQYVIQQSETVRNDDYYYYGDYESRIRRFGYASPFNYDDDYYDAYMPYAPASYQAYPDTTKYAYTPEDYTYDPYYDDLGVYSAYDFGYGDYWGYDDFGFGMAYSTFVYTGGTRTSHNKNYSHSNSTTNGPVFVRASSLKGGFSNPSFGVKVRNNNAIATERGPGLTFTRGAASTTTGGRIAPVFTGARPGGNNAVYPGRPMSSSTNGQTINVAGVNRQVRPADQAPRTFTPQRTVEAQRSAPAPAPASTSSSSNSGGGSSSGGGGRPVRP